MKFKANLHGQEITGDVVNPGDWFGKTWVVAVGDFSSIFYAVEGNSEGDVIDALANHDEHGKSIRMASDDEGFDDEEVCRAGNAGEPVDLENVHIYGKAFHDHRMHPTSIPYNSEKDCSDILYIMDDGTLMNPIDYECYDFRRR